MRYELVEGTSSKFWQIETAKDGKSFTVTWGRIGATGKNQQIKKFKHAYQAEVARDKLVKEKVKKGYKATNARAAGKEPAKPKKAAKLTSNADLEDAIRDDPTDAGRWMVWADWLQQQGDPRGELIALRANKKTKQANAYRAANADVLLGEAKRFLDENPFAGQTWMPKWAKAKQQEYEISIATTDDQFGFIESISIAGLDEDGQVASALAAIVESPLGRFVRAIHLSAAHNERYSGGSGQPDFGTVIAALARAKPTALRTLSLDAESYQLSWTTSGNLAPLWKTVPRLETLFIELGAIELGARLDLPRLRMLTLQTGGLDRTNLAAIAKSELLALEGLKLYLGRHDYGGNVRVADVKPLLAGTFPKLKWLGLCNSEIQGEIVQAVAGAKLVKQLAELDFSQGTMIDSELEPALDALARHKNLALFLSNNYLSPDMTRRLKKLFRKRVTCESQRYDEDEYQYPTTDDRYTNVGE